MTNAPLYYARGRTVRKRPVETRQKDGSSGMTLDSPICTMSPAVDDSAAINIAAKLSLHPDLVTALSTCAQTFREYEAGHAAKGTDEGNAKAERNGELADMAEAVLAKVADAAADCIQAAPADEAAP